MTWLLWLFLSFVSPAQAQCNGSFGAATVCGSLTGGPPSQVPFNTISGGIFTVPTVVTGSVGAATANSTAINAAIQTAGTAGGGTVVLPCGQIYVGATIDNNVSNVTVVSAGWMGSPSLTQFCAKILPTFSGVVLQHRTPYGSGSTPQNSGGGFAGILVDGNSNSTANLVIDSISGGYYDLASNEAADSTTGAGHANVLIKSCTSGTNLVVCDVQLVKLLKLNVQQTVTAIDAVQIVNGSNADFSGNRAVYFNITHKNGLALNCVGMDGNNIWFGSFRTSGGSGNAILMGGVTATGGGCYDNTFQQLTATSVAGSPTIYAQGTSDAGVTNSVNNTILNMDLSGFPSSGVTAGIGSSWNYIATAQAGSYPAFGIGVTGTSNGPGLAPIIFGGGANSTTQLEIYPGEASRTTRMLFFDRTNVRYENSLFDGLSHTWNTSGTSAMTLAAGALSFNFNNQNDLNIGNSSLASTNTPTSITFDGSFANTCGSTTQNKIYLLSSGIGSYGIGVCTGEVWFDSGGSFAWFTGGSTQLAALSSAGVFSLGITSAGNQIYPLTFTNSSMTANTAVGLTMQAQGTGPANDTYSIRVINDLFDIVIPNQLDLLNIDRGGNVSILAGNLSMVSGAVHSWNSDTGISRDSAAVIDFGNGTATNSSATLRMSSFTIGGTASWDNFSTGAGTQTFTNSPCSALTTERWIKVKFTGSTSTFFIPACS